MTPGSNPEDDNRSEGRSNVFLTGTLYAGSGSCSVRIRNLSDLGALLEGADLPPFGTKVQLLRGSLRASGQVAWQRDQQAGVSFDDRIDVQSWVQRVGHTGQQRIDAAVAAIKRSEPIPSDLHSPSDTKSLMTISADLDQVCQRLAQTPEMSVQLAEEFLRLEAIAQDLRRLATGRKV